MPKQHKLSKSIKEVIKISKNFKHNDIAFFEINGDRYSLYDNESSYVIVGRYKPIELESPQESIIGANNIIPIKEISEEAIEEAVSVITIKEVHEL